MEEKNKDFYINHVREVTQDLNKIEHNLTKLYKLLISLVCISGITFILLPFIATYIDKFSK